MVPMTPTTHPGGHPAAVGLFDEEDFAERPTAAGFTQTLAEDIREGDEVLLVPGKGSVVVTAVIVQTEGFYRPKVYLAPGLGWWSRQARLFVRRAEGAGGEVAA